MNKKGIWKEKEMLMMIFYAFMMIFVCVIILLGFSIFISSEMDVSKIDQLISQYRLFNSPDCMIYSDGNGFLVRGVVDYDKFKESNLDGCLHYPDRKVLAIKLTLKDSDMNELKTVEINKKLSSLRILCSTGDYGCYPDRQYVLYSENNQIKEGFIDFVMVGDKD